MSGGDNKTDRFLGEQNSGLTCLWNGVSCSQVTFLWVFTTSWSSATLHTCQGQNHCPWSRSKVVTNLIYEGNPCVSHLRLPVHRLPVPPPPPVPSSSLSLFLLFFVFLTWTWQSKLRAIYQLLSSSLQGSIALGTSHTSNSSQTSPLHIMSVFCSAHGDIT